MTNQNPWGSSAIRNEQWAVENMGFDEKKALRFEENARLPRLFYKKYTGRFDQETTKDYIKVGSSTLLDKSL